jgi:pyridoxamine 5'-phosphate oxidase family protein
MSVFTPREIEYLRSQRLGRLATIGRDGQPHVTPLGFIFNETEDTIDIGGIGFGGSKKWRDAQHNQRITLVVDDVVHEMHAIEIRGVAEVHHAGGTKINPQSPASDEQFLRLRPSYIVSWGLEPGVGVDPHDFRPNGRHVP